MKSAYVEFRALVVDDDPIVRRMVSFALQQVGFDCDQAVDGVGGQELVNARQYDLLVTDLRMPNKNGHALATECAKSHPQLVIVVHTAVEEPRLTEDLIVRGIDDVIYKPANYETFAVKALGFVKRRREQISSAANTAGAPSPPKKPAQSKAAETEATAISAPDTAISSSELHRRLAEIDSLFPLSPVAFDVNTMASQQTVETSELAAAIEQEPALSAEVLRLANSADSSPTPGGIDSVEKAVVRLGRRQIGDLALAAGERDALAQSRISWIDRELLWKRSLAAGICLRALEDVDAGETVASSFLCALFHPIGRIVLATLFPDAHRKIVQRCGQSGELLDDLEKQTFGAGYGQVGAKLLSAWRIPADVRLPLEHINQRFDQLATLPNNVRQRVELVKLSILFASMTAELWEPWDLIDLPRASLLRDLKIPPVEELCTTVIDSFNLAVTAHARPAQAEENKPAPPIGPAAVYLSPDEKSFDLLRPLLNSIGIPLKDQTLEPPRRILINGLSVGDSKLREIIENWDTVEVRGIVRTDQQASLFASGAAIRLPTTVKRMLEFFAE